MATAELLSMKNKRDGDKQKALDSALAQIERQFGKGSIMKFSEAAERPAVEAIPSGSLALDLALGVAGDPSGFWAGLSADYSHRVTEGLSLFGEARAGYKSGTGLAASALGGLRWRW